MALTSACRNQLPLCCDSCLPRIVHAEVALDAIAPAAVGAAHGERVAGLGKEAEAGQDLRAEATGELELRVTELLKSFALWRVIGR